MEWPKLKNIILIILLLVNLFLLAILGTQERNSARYQEQALADAVAVLERNGIQLDAEQLPKELGLTAMTVEREQASEGELAAALLGECRVTYLGSGRYSYENASGTAEFRSGGNFSFSFTAPVQTTGAAGEEHHAKAVLEKIGFSPALASRREENGQVILTWYQTWKGLSVFSCQATLVYENGCLQSIVGRRLMGTPQSDPGEGESITLPTALLRILNGVTDLGDICSRITAMTPGYVLNTASEESRLIPVWYVNTDVGTYSLNALTGVLERAQ